MKIQITSIIASVLLATVTIAKAEEITPKENNIIKNKVVELYETAAKEGIENFNFDKHGDSLKTDHKEAVAAYMSAMKSKVLSKEEKDEILQKLILSTRLAFPEKAKNQDSTIKILNTYDHFITILQNAAAKDKNNEQKIAGFEENKTYKHLTVTWTGSDINTVTGLSRSWEDISKIIYKHNPSWKWKIRKIKTKGWGVPEGGFSVIAQQTNTLFKVEKSWTVDALGNVRE